MREPVGEREQLVFFLGSLRDFAAEEARLGRFAGAGVEDRTARLYQHGLVALELVFVVLVRAFFIGDLVVDPREEIGPVVIVVLGPALEGVVVALRAIKLRAEEDA